MTRPDYFIRPLPLAFCFDAVVTRAHIQGCVASTVGALRGDSVRYESCEKCGWQHTRVVCDFRLVCTQIDCFSIAVNICEIV